MKLEKLSAIAEILSAVAVVFTLVYLAIQTQQNTAAVRANTREAALANAMEILRLQFENPDLVGSLVKPELSPEEESRLGNYLSIHLERYINAFYQFRDGAMDEPTYITVRQPFLFMLSTRRGRLWWKNTEPRVRAFPELQAQVDILLGDAPVRDEILNSFAE